MWPSALKGQQPHGSPVKGTTSCSLHLLSRREGPGGQGHFFNEGQRCETSAVTALAGAYLWPGGGALWGAALRASRERGGRGTAGEGRQHWGSPLGFRCLTRCSRRATGILPVWGGERPVTGMTEVGEQRASLARTLTSCPSPAPGPGHLLDVTAIALALSLGTH